MRTATGVTLIASVRARAEIRAAYISDANLLELINLGICALLDVILDENETYNLKSGTINVASGTAAHTLPADFYNLRGVEILDTDSKYKTLRPFDWGARSRDMEPTGFTRTMLQYELGGILADATATPTGPTIVLHPTPDWSLTAGLRVWYIPSLPNLVIAGTVNPIDLSNGWEEFVILWAITRCLAKMQEPAELELALLGDAEKRVRARAAKRDVSAPTRIRDVSADDSEDINDLAAIRDYPT